MHGHVVRRAAGYSRVSTRKQADAGYSLDEQRSAIAERCDGEGWDLTLYEDAGLSAREGKHRPELERLLRDVEAGKFDAVVFRDIDRVGRSVIDLSRIVKALAAVRIVTLTGRNVDVTTAEGRLQFNVLASVAEYERDKIGERVSGSARARAQRGLFPGGRRMKYGYRRQGKDEPPEIVEAEAAIVRRIFEEAAAGKSQRHITQGLNRDGIRTQQGDRWEQGTVARIQRDPTYKGCIAIKGEIVFEGGGWRIVSDELWNRVAILRAARDLSPGSGRGRKPTGSHLFTGHLLRCECGAGMTPRTYRSGREVYVCRRHYGDPEACPHGPILRESVDTAALRYFERMALDVDATREQLQAGTDRKLAEVRALRHQAERERLQKVEAQERIESDYLAGALPADAYARLSDRLSDEVAALAAQCERLASQEAETAAGAAIADTEQEVLEQLSAIRAAVAGEVRNAEGIDALRAALTRVFERFLYLPNGDPGDDPTRPHWSSIVPVLRREYIDADVPPNVPLPITETNSLTACSWLHCLVGPIPIEGVAATA